MTMPRAPGSEASSERALPGTLPAQRPHQRLNLGEGRARLGGNRKQAETACTVLSVAGTAI